MRPRFQPSSPALHQSRTWKWLLVWFDSINLQCYATRFVCHWVRYHPLPLAAPGSWAWSSWHSRTHQGNMPPLPTLHSIHWTQGLVERCKLWFHMIPLTVYIILATYQLLETKSWKAWKYKTLEWFTLWQSMAHARFYTYSYSTVITEWQRTSLTVKDGHFRTVRAYLCTLYCTSRLPQHLLGMWGNCWPQGVGCHRPWRGSRSLCRSSVSSRRTIDSNLKRRAVESRVRVKVFVSVVSIKILVAIHEEVYFHWKKTLSESLTLQSMPQKFSHYNSFFYNEPSQ